MTGGDIPAGPLHFLSTSWDDFSPRWSLAVPGNNEPQAFNPEPGGELAVEFSGEPLCVGTLKDGVHNPCPGSRSPMERFSWCPECAKEVIPHPSCIFEPRCDGHLCPDAFCSRPHAVYLAFFGHRVKVGMTSMARLRERLIEQGADGYVLLTGTENREEARGLEKVFSSKLRIPQRVRGATKLILLSGRPDRRSMKARAEEVSRGVRNLTGGSPGELVVLDGYPRIG